MKTIGLCVRQIRNYGMFTAYIRVGAFNKLPCCSSLTVTMWYKMRF